MSASTIVELLISVTTLISAWYIGNKSVWGQRLAVPANIGWWIYIILFQHWGMVPMEIFFSIMVVRNLIKWEKEAK